MSASEILLVYDKQCPVCDIYCNLARIDESVGRLKLIDARHGGQIMDEITTAGLDIDQGMVLKVGDRLYYGSDAIHMLALLGTRSGLFNRLTFWIFRSRRLSTLLYPVLRAGRGLLLKVLGRTRINNLGLPGRKKF